MDVTCERCDTEYEFDETLVSSRGTTVKCTNCGHLFKVYRPGSTPPQGEPDERALMIRHRNGQVEPIGSLRELQVRIAQGTVTRDDAISRGGQDWKPLADIAELDSFFATDVPRAPAIEPPAGGPPRQRTRTLEGPGTAPPTGPTPPMRDTRPADAPEPSGVPRVPTLPPPALSAPALVDAKRTVRGLGPSAEVKGPSATAPMAPGNTLPLGSARPPGTTIASTVPLSQPGAARPRVSTPPPPPVAATSSGPETSESRTTPTEPDLAPETIVDEPGATARLRPAEPSAPGLRLYVDEEEERRRMHGSARAQAFWPWAIGGLLVIAGLFVVWLWTRVGPPGAVGAEPEIQTLLQSATTALARHDARGFERALGDLDRAAERAPSDPQVLVVLARAHADWAQSLTFDMLDAEARASEGVASDPSLADLRSLRDEHLAAARDALARAAAEDATGADLLLARAEVERLGGATGAAREALEQARATNEADPAWASELEALLQMDANEGRVASALDAARIASEASPERAAPRLLVARALLAQGDVAGARAALQEILARHPEQAGAVRLRDAIEAGLPPAPPIVRIVDAGAAAGATSPTEAPAAEGRGEEATPSGAGSDRGFGWYMERGEEALAAGDAAHARALFERAARERHHGGQAQTALGRVALHQGDVSEAERRFRAGAAAGDPDAYLGLGDAYRRMGRDDEALEAYEAYLAARPDGPGAGTARRQVRALRERLERAQVEEEPAPEPTASQPPAGPPPSQAEAPSPAPDEEPAPPRPSPAPAPAPETEASPPEPTASDAPASEASPEN